MLNARGHRTAAPGKAKVAFAASLLAVSISAPVAAELSSLGISQAVQLDDPEPAVRVYLEADGSGGAPAPELGLRQLTATLGENPLELRQSYPFKSGGEGVAYVFLIDISRSLSTTEFDLIREALDVWILSLRPLDRVAVIAFGDESRVLVDFTADAEAIQTVLYSLGPSDNQTVLHQALKDGLELCRRRDPDLPGRRVLMVLTDGRDEGSGLTTDDILEHLRRDPVPIYAIGFSRIRDPGQRKRYLDLLRRFAANSGGAFYEGTTDTLGTAYEAIRREINGVWVADFVCPQCRADGEEYRLQVEVEDEGRILSAGRSLRLLPVRRAAQVASPPLSPTTASPVSESEVSEELEPIPDETPQATSEDASDEPPGWLWLLLVLAAAGLVGWFLAKRRTKKSAAAPPPNLPPRPQAETRVPGPAAALGIPDSAGRDAGDPADDDSAVASASELAQEGSGPIPVPQTYTLDSGVETTRPPRPAIMRLVRLVVVRGTKPGRQYTLTLFDRATIGSRSTCDCVLSDPGVAPEQFAILQFDGRVYVRNLAGAKPTLVDGAALTEQQILKNGSLVGNREFIVRVAYDEARPVNT